MATETSSAFARALSNSTPAFYWFRDQHAAGDGKITVQGVVASSAALDPSTLQAQINGIPARLSCVSMASQADERFWFLPATHRAGVVIEAPPLAGTTSAAVTLLPRSLPRGQAYRHTFHLYFDHTQVGVTPPVENIERVSGKGATAYNYFNNGATDFHRFVGLAAAHGIDALDARTRILDWGSGCARLTRHLLALPSGRGRVKGADIDADNIAWSRQHIDKHAFDVVPLMPPTPYSASSFDLVLANSVLSHLSASAMHAWLGEVKRILRPGGLALLSYHGDFSLAGFCARAPAFVEKVWQSGFNDDQKASELDTVIADTTYYRQTFMTDEAALAIFAQHLGVQGSMVGMVSRFQNVAVLRRP